MISPQDLSNVEIPFSHEEINNIIKRMPNDKAPGPDGFNGLFMRKFWNIMKHPFYNMCSKFYAGNLELSSINTAYITLIPKNKLPCLSPRLQTYLSCDYGSKGFDKINFQQSARCYYPIGTVTNKASSKAEQYKIV
jgi:hypothetical protein